MAETRRRNWPRVVRATQFWDLEAMADSKTNGAGDAAAVAASICAEHGNRPEALIEILHALQAQLGYVPAECLGTIANAVNLSRAEVHGVFTFYHDFRDTPAGRHVVKLCRAEACQAVGCEALVPHAEKVFGTSFGATGADGRVTLEAVYCLGNCALGPAALVDGELHGMLNNNMLENISHKLD
jgi:formate dehydrogenase subunit gamma